MQQISLLSSASVVLTLALRSTSSDRGTNFPHRRDRRTSDRRTNYPDRSLSAAS